MPLLLVFIMLVTAMLPLPARAEPPAAGSLVVRLETREESYLPYQVIVVDYVLRNQTANTVWSLKRFPRVLEIEGADGQVFPYVMWEGCGVASAAAIDAGTEIRLTEFLFADGGGLDGQVLARPGTYTLHAQSPATNRLVSASIRIVEPGALDAQFVAAIGGLGRLRDIMRGAWGPVCGDAHMSRCMQELIVALESNPSPAYGPGVCWMVVSKAVSAPHQMSVHDGRRFGELCLARWPSGPIQLMVKDLLDLLKPRRHGAAGRTDEASEGFLTGGSSRRRARPRLQVRCGVLAPVAA